MKRNNTQRRSKPTAIDLFSGCGGLTLGLKRAGFRILAAVDCDELAGSTYRKNHRRVRFILSDIRKVKARTLMSLLGLKSGELGLLAGCPPCQGFSNLRTLNGKRRVRDPNNDLIFQFIRFIRAMRPQAVMIENVPRLSRTEKIRRFKRELKTLGYKFEARVFDASSYGVPQRRKRMVAIAVRRGSVVFAEPLKHARMTVKAVIGGLPAPRKSSDPAHSYRTTYSRDVAEIIRRIPKNGGSRTDLPKRYHLRCHLEHPGFYDVYGRMRWEAVAPTITSGCVNPSKGRFLHPAQNRAITLREAAMLQGFPKNYFIDISQGKYPAAQMVGNAFPPAFAEHHARRLRGFIFSAY